MAYIKQTWANDESGGTPLSAARLDHMEDGIEAAITVDGSGAAVGQVLAVTQVDGSNSAVVFGIGPAVTAPRLAQQPGRRGFELALTERADRRLVWLWIGASTAAGSSGQTFTKQTIQLEKMLQASYNPPGIPGGYTIKAREGWTVSGPTAEIQDVDLRQLRQLNPGSYIEHATGQPTTGVEIMYLEGTGAGQFTVDIDGEIFTVTPDPGAPANSPTGLWVSPVLAREVHTVRITAVGTVVLGNVHFNDGDHEVGCVLYNAARPGSGTTPFLPSNDGTFWTRLAALAPDVVSIQLGHNDMGSITVEQFKTNLGVIVGEINTRVPGKTVWVPLIAQQSTDSRYPAFAQALEEFAATRPNTTFHSYREFFPTTEAEYVASTEGLYDPDMTHLTSKGQKLAAQVLADSFGFPSRQTWPVEPPAADDLTWDWTTDANLLAFYDMNTLPGEIGSTVSSVPVTHGSLAAALEQADPAKQPSVFAGPNGRKALRTGAEADQNTIAAAIGVHSLPATVVGVFRRTSTATASWLWNGTGATHVKASIGGPAPRNYMVGTNVAAPSVQLAPSDTDWHVVVAVYDGASSRFYSDSKTSVAFSAPGTTFEGLSLGRTNSDTSLWWESVCAGLAVFDRALTDFEVGRLLDDLSGQMAVPLG